MNCRRSHYACVCVFNLKFFVFAFVYIQLRSFEINVNSRKYKSCLIVVVKGDKFSFTYVQKGGKTQNIFIDFAFKSYATLEASNSGKRWIMNAL